MKTTTRTALMILALTLGFSSVVRAQDKVPPTKGKQSEKAPKKGEEKTPPPIVFDFSSEPDAPESDLPAITKKGAL